MSSHTGPSVTQQRVNKKKRLVATMKELVMTMKIQKKMMDKHDYLMRSWKQNMNPFLGIVQEKLQKAHSDWQV